ncbi:RNA-directed RNA polymerase [Crassisporium funariophilum]|nr:RNA-directed RNA polymerase [Crassisporium funariophilum]
MRAITLRANPALDDETWEFKVPNDALTLPKNQKPTTIFGKVVSFSIEAITLRIEQFPSNRILNADDPSKFILMSFNRTFRFPDQSPKVTVEYIVRMMKRGFLLNGVQYRFYHHSHSQLRGRSCFLRAANTDAELDLRIYRMGDFGKIMNVAKRAKRIALLFSSAQIDYHLDPKCVADIPDIQLGDEVFSDGCGLISKRLAIQLSRTKKIVFRETRYTPTVFQIRYLGYKGVLMLHPELDTTTKHLAQFRKSMKKFTSTADNTFSVVGHSRPYSFGRLNNDIIVLLSSLGVSNEKLLAKQQEYFDWITNASKDATKAIDFLSCLELYPLVERALLDGIDDPAVKKEIRRLQSSEVSKARDERTNKFKSRMMIHKSRRLFGVCDPYQVLKEGEVHIRITAARRGPATPIHADVVVVRNPCLHPGDCLKLRAVQHPKLAHLVDCIVFATVAKPGHKAAPSMSSGGDLDGDEFFVCWDSDLVPSRVSESYDYPGNKEFNKKEVTRADLAAHFASYNASGVAKVSALHAKWARSSPLGALCVQCQELNALHSQSVDGANIRIPDKLATPPEQTEPYILDLLEEASDKFSILFTESASRRTDILVVDQEEGKKLLGQLLQSKQSAVSEYELFNLACRLATKHSIDIRPYLCQIDIGALTTAEKHTITTTLSLSAVDYPYIWNSLVRSDILTARDLYQRDLGRPFSLHRLYSSRISGLSTFFEYLRMATQDYTRKVLILQTDPRFAIGIFMRGVIPWDEDPEVNENVVVCSFMPRTASSATLRPCTAGYRLHCSDYRLQLYDKQIQQTFIFVTRPPAASGVEVATSIALDKISRSVLQNLGKVLRKPVTAIELHVVSNRDRVAHQLFDLWFEHVPTEESVRRFDRKPAPYRLNALQDVEWDALDDPWLKGAFYRNKHTADSMAEYLSRKMLPEIDKILDFAIRYHAEDEIFLVFVYVIQQQPLSHAFAIRWIERYPSLTFALLKAYPPDNETRLNAELESFVHSIVRNIIRSANDTRIAALVALEKIAKSIGMMNLEHYIDILMLTALSVRSKNLVQEVLLVLNESRLEHAPSSAAAAYGHKHALGVVFDCAEEAADECPCNDDGRPKKKQRVPPSHAKLAFGPDYEKSSQVVATIRIDARNSLRLHSHVRLQAASKAENRWIDAPIMDGVVVQALKGELKINLFHPAPPEMEVMDWNMYDAGSIATTNAMTDALKRLLGEREECCAFYSLITGEGGSEISEELETELDESSTIPEGLNESQITAMKSWRSPLSLIWGPPGKNTIINANLYHCLILSDTSLLSRDWKNHCHGPNIA